MDYFFAGVKHFTKNWRYINVHPPDTNYVYDKECQTLTITE